MTTASFKNAQLNVTQTVTTTVAQLTRTTVVLDSHPDVEIEMDAKQLTDLNLKIGDTVTLEPVTNSYTLTADVPAKQAAVAGTEKKGSSPVFGARFSNVLD